MATWERKIEEGPPWHLEDVFAEKGSWEVTIGYSYKNVSKKQEDETLNTCTAMVNLVES